MSAFASLLRNSPRHPSGWPARMLICGQYEARHGCHEWGATHVLTIKDRDSRYFGPAGFGGGRQLVVEFDDTVFAGDPDAPTMAHLAEISAWVDKLPANAALIIHCQQGLNRSTAIGLGLLARETSPLRAAYLLHQIRPQASPNGLIVRLWDERLRLDGALAAAAQHFPCRFWRQGDGLGDPSYRQSMGA